MPDRSNRKLVLLDAKRRFGLGQLDVCLPQLLVAPVSDVGAQQVGAFGQRRSEIETLVHRNLEHAAGGVIGVLQFDREACRGALIAL